MDNAIHPDAAPGSMPPIRVLLVEDHDHVLWGLGKLIEGEWPRMVVAGNARTTSEALAALRARAVDVVVLDVFLGRENSLEHLPAQIAACGAAFVVLTGDGNPALHRLALQSGARAVLPKEGPADALLREIERAVARQPNCLSAVGTGPAGSVSST
jgi:DNA-binding NarL/FixJ family response regulator